MKPAPAADLLHVLAQHVGCELDPGPLSRALESADDRDATAAAMAWMQAPQSALPTPTELRALVEAERVRRVSTSRPTPASMAGAAGGASRDIAADTAEIVRRKCLPPGDAEHLDATAYAREMAALERRYPAAGWGETASAFAAETGKRRAA